MTLLTLKLFDASNRNELAECKVDILLGANEQQIHDKVMERLDRLGWQPVPDLAHWLRSTQNGNDQAMQRVIHGTAATVSIALNPKICPHCAQHEETIRQYRYAQHGNTAIVDRVRELLVEAGRLGQTETAPEKFSTAISHALRDLETKKDLLRDIGLALSLSPESETSYANNIRSLIEGDRANKSKIIYLEEERNNCNGNLKQTQTELEAKKNALQKMGEDIRALKQENAELRSTSRSSPNSPRSNTGGIGHL